MKATRKQFLAVVEKHGASVDENDPCTFYVDAPAGKRWACDGVHALAHQHDNGHGHRWKPEAYGDAIQRMNCGLEDCDDPDCDICNES
jgi:hypothetical protein